MTDFLKVLFCYSDLPKGDQNVWVDQFEHYIAFLLFRKGVKITKNALFLNPNNHTKPHTNDFNPDILLMVLVDEKGVRFFDECAVHFEQEFEHAKRFFVSACPRSFQDEKYFQIETFEKTFQGSKEGLANLLDLVREVVQEPKETALSKMLGQGYGAKVDPMLVDLKRGLRYKEHDLVILYEQNLKRINEYVTKYNFPVMIYLLSGVGFSDKEREEFLTTLRFGGELALENPEVLRFLWYEEDFLKTEENLLMLDAIKRDLTMIKGLNIVRSPFEELKEEIHTRFIDLKLEKAIYSQRSVVYLINDCESEEVAKFKELLEKKGLEIVQLKPNDTDRNLLKNHRFYLTIADSVIVYQEDQNDAWINIKLVDLFKAPGFGRKRPFSVKLVIVNQKVKFKKGVHLNGVTILHRGVLDYDEVLLESINKIKVDA